MQKLFAFLSLLIFPLFAFAQKGEVTVKGTLKNVPKDTEVKLSHVVNYFDFGYTNEEVKPNKKGEFEITFTLHYPQSVYLQVGEKSLAFYAEAGKKVALEADVEDFKGTTKFSGDLATTNTANLEYANTKPSANAYMIAMREPAMNPQAFRNFADSLREVQKTFWEGKELNETFKKLKLAEIDYSYASSVSKYPMYRPYFMGKKGTLNLPDSLTKVDVKANDDFLLYSMDYRNYIVTLPKQAEQALQAFNQKKGGLDAAYDLAAMILEGNSLAYSRANIVKGELSYGTDFKQAEALLERYRKDHKDAPAMYIEYLDEQHAKIKKLQKGNEAPAFTLKSPEDEEFSLSDLKGSVVYLDFWASWCAPCRAEMPHSKKLKEKFKGKDVKFLYVSIDEDEEAWVKAIEKLEIEGVHVLAKGFKHDVPVSYNVNAIPAYFIIGKDGKIFEGRPARPSASEKLTEQLEAALAE